MMSTPFIDWEGMSGKTYRYFFLNLSLPIEDVAVNYAFVKHAGDNMFRPLYFGESTTAPDRIGIGHEKWTDAIALGMTHVMAHATQGGEMERRNEERDLIGRWAPILNVQYRQVR